LGDSPAREILPEEGVNASATGLDLVGGFPPKGEQGKRDARFPLCIVA
jgi:hypothetical protein